MDEKETLILRKQQSIKIEESILLENEVKIAIEKSTIEQSQKQAAREKANQERAESRKIILEKIAAEVAACEEKLKSNPKKVLPDDSFEYNIQKEGNEGENLELSNSAGDSKKLNERKQKIRELTSQLKAFQIDLMDGKYIYSNIERKCSTAESEIKEIKERNLKNIFDEQVILIEKLTKQLEEMKTQNRELMVQVEIEKEKKKKMMNSIVVVDYLVNENSILSDSLSYLESEYLLLHKQSENIKELMELVNNDLTTSKLLANATQLRLDKLKVEETLKSDTSELNRLKQEIETLKESNSSIESKILENNDKVKTLKSTERGSAKSCRSVKSQLLAMNEEIDQKKFRNQDFEMQA